MEWGPVSRTAPAASAASWGASLNRPIYETQTDLQREREVMERLCRAWSVGCQKLPLKYIVDYGMLRDEKLVAWLEIKCRNKKYDSMILSAAKWFAGKDLARQTTLSFVVVYAFPDSSIYYLTIEPEMTPDIQFEGRTDRNDWQDREPCVMLPLEWFKELK